MTEDYQPNIDGNGFETNVIEVANYLFSHKLFIGIAAFSTAAIVGCWTFFFSSPTYQATSTVIYNYKPANPLENDSAAYWSRQATVDNKLYVLSVFINSDRFQKAMAIEMLAEDSKAADESIHLKSAKRIIQRYFQNEGVTGIDSIAKAMGGLISVNIDSERQVIRLSSHTAYPLLSQAVVNLGSDTLVKINYQIILKELNSVVDFIENQVNQTKDRLYTLEEKLSDYQKDQKILNISDNGSRLDSVQMDRSLEINKLKVERASAEIWMTEIENTISEFKKNLQAGIDSPLYLMQLQRKLDLLLYQRTLSKNDRSISSTDRNIISDELDTTLSEFQKSFQSLQSSRVTLDPWKYLSSLESAMATARHNHSQVLSKINAIENVNNTELEKYNTLPIVFRKINQLQREILQTSNLYQQLNNKMQETAIKKAGMSNDLEILRYAQHAGQPVDMAVWKKYVLSFVAGAMVLIMILSLRYILIPTVRSRNDLQKSGVEVIAEIPYVRMSDKDVHINAKAPLLLKWDLASDEANAIRQARFSIEEKFKLHEHRSKGEARVLTVCSANSKEGKTFVASNIAHSLSVAQFKVLILDLDLLNSSVRSYFDIEKEERTDLKALGIEEETYFERTPVNAFLDVVDIPKCDNNLSNILETPLLGDYLTSMRSEYDVIIVDTPPLRNSMEALIASRHSSGMIFVANQRNSLRHDVFKTINTLRENYDRRIFAVLNFSYDELNSSRRRVAS